MATVVVYGIAADMTFMSVGKAFGLGFTAAIEQVGLLVVAGALVASLVLRDAARHRHIGCRRRAGRPRRIGSRGGLALLQPAGQDAPRRALGLALTLLAFAALADALAARRRRGVGDEDPARSLGRGRPAACRDRGVAGLVVRLAPGAGEQDDRGRVGWAWLAVAIPIALLILQAVAQMPSEPRARAARANSISASPSR